jgi:hypothetical protein
MKKWYLIFETFDSLENEIGSARVVEKIELKAQSEDDAIVEGKKIWEEAVKTPFKGWDHKTYPHSPCVIYEIPLV